ncbi:MAG: hypothetical protein KGS45_10655 [Planctomycetes bacterium]|nr:hypothetical protein [Planctomycetota bacterium]
MSRRLNQIVPPWLFAFSGCAIAVLGAMGWITYRALTLEVAEAKARAEATRQEAVRLALWRMDSWMTSLIAREAARPYFHYVSFYPTDRPYALYSSDFTIDALNASETVSPSPLLTSPPPDVKLYFQIWPDGHITSPQVPTGGLRGLALLADANGNTIDAASGTLAELSQLLTNVDSRRALGAGEQLPLREIALSDSSAQFGNQIGNQFGTLQPPGSPEMGTSAPDQAKAESRSEGGPGGQVAQRAGNDARPTQQLENDGRQRWQTSNDYEVRQQVAETTRNLSQNRAPSYQTGSPSNTAPTANVQTAGNADQSNTADPKAVAADVALRKSTGEAVVSGAEDKSDDAARTARAEPNKSEPNNSETSNKDLDAKLAALKKEQTKEQAIEGSPKTIPGAPAGKEAGRDTATADPKRDHIDLAKGPAKPAATTAESADTSRKQAAQLDDKAAATPVTGSPSSSTSGSGGRTDLSDPKPKEAAATRPTADLSIPLGSPNSPDGKSFERGSFPVVVRSIAVEPTPLITACVASPQELLSHVAAPAPTTSRGSSSELSAHSVSPALPPTTCPTTGPTIAPPRDSGTPIVHASVPFNLFLTRQVPLDSGRVVQGMWLDWPMLRTSLLALSQDLLPGATLELCAPMSPSAAAGDAGLMLASIPARLVLPADPDINISMISLLSGSTWTPTRIAIIGGWIAVLGGILAIGWVLRQSVQLGERRGRFVSAVTHELRTPLTTFALYSQMLADGMVQDPDAQREYHQTLRKESDRLSRIVESVLDYARLGKHRGDANGNTIRPSIGAADLLAALEPHLRSRASVSGLDLIMDAPDLSHVTLRAERDSIERILENLVENAGKYAAAEGRDNRLHLTARLDGRWLNLDLADHGPGIAPGEAKRVFAPFERGKAQQDGSKPGLGLGLAFARGLARDLGGDLTLLSSQDSMRAGFGAIFRLRIPAEIQAQNAESATDSAAIADQDQNPPADPDPTTESRPQ